MAQVELANLLESVQQQQTALLQAHAESLRLQQLLIQHLLGRGAEQVSTAYPIPAPTRQETCSGPDTASLLGSLVSAIQAQGSALGAQPSAPQPANAPTSEQCPAPAAEHPTVHDLGQTCAQQTTGVPGALVPTAEQGAEITGPAPQEGPPTATLETTSANLRPPTRASRYFQPHPARPARIVSLHELSTLRRLADAGDAARLILQFGPHRGETLGQVAQADPAYVRELALKAQRPNVRAAALQLVSVLEAIEREQKTAKRGRGSAPDTYVARGGR
jgi:hypothetical protein